MAQGGKPDFIFKYREYLKPRQSLQGTTNPTNIPWFALLGLLAGALSVLIDAGTSRQEAGRWMESHLRLAGITHPDGSRITASQVHRWRDTVSSGKAAENQIEAARVARDLVKTDLLQKFGDSYAKQLAEGIVEDVARLRIPIIPPTKSES